MTVCGAARPADEETCRTRVAALAEILGAPCVRVSPDHDHGTYRIADETAPDEVVARDEAFPAGLCRR